MRIYYVDPYSWNHEAVADTGFSAQRWRPLARKAAELGFDTIMAPLPAITDGRAVTSEKNPDDTDKQILSGISEAAPACVDRKLAFVIDLHVDGITEDTIEQWVGRLAAWCAAGVAGYCCHGMQAIPAAGWDRLIRAVHEHHPECFFMAWTPGLTPPQLADLCACGFLYTFNSVPWWDYRSSWLLEEQERLSKLAPCIAPMTDIEKPGLKQPPGPTNAIQAQRLLWTAAFMGEGLLMRCGMEKLAGEQAVAQANRWQASRARDGESTHLLTGALSTITALFRSGQKAALLIINTDIHTAAVVHRNVLASRLPDSYVLDESVPPTLEASGYSLIPATTALHVKSPAGSSSTNGCSSAPLTEARIVIEHVTPRVDGGGFPVKRCLGQALCVEADVFMDGHSRLAVSLLWKATDETHWRRVAMQALGNDRWRAEFVPERLGRHSYAIQAWQDDWETHCEALKKKRDAGQDVSLDVEEARLLIVHTLEHARNNQPVDGAVHTGAAPVDAAHAAELTAILREIGRPRESRHIDRVLSSATAEIMYALGPRAFEITSRAYPLTVERREAVYAAWYELFPRSQSATPGMHGTFKDVEARLPYIQEMGFDVLYMPPIHPIGLTNRKGRNNSLSASEGDPGSPYAIGSAQGGHDAVHPELGTIDDFQGLVRAAKHHDIELALDFAIQCSPDHPWLALHPEWFDWRADGSLRYAENPPKRYEDIVNPDFYLGGSALWRALRDVVLFWVNQGIRLFRVDNPHTKPVPFWQWLIANVQAAHPDVIFLSEAFTRPKMMYRLAKIGFSQSYTYFTWRNDKQELTDYLTELSSPPVADFFRPHFFVNTPDINPYFLQNSGRPGFLIRAALAATTSGLWGMYNGFELCEASSVAGKEEYQDSEKYELRSWDWDRPGNIAREITRLNQIRRLNPALQTHLGICFHDVDNERILFFTKSTPEKDNIVLVIISLDPHGRQGGTLDLPAWLWPATGEPLHVEDLFEEGRFELQGSRHYVEVAPEKPFLIWRLMPRR